MSKIAFEKILSKWLFSDFVSKFETCRSHLLAIGSHRDIHQMKDLDLLYQLYDGIWLPFASKAVFGLWKNVFSSIFGR